MAMTPPPQKRRRRRVGAPLNHEPEAVVFARENAQLTQKELAELCGYSEQLQCDIEAGRRNADPGRLRLIAEACNCPVVFLERRREVAP